MQIPANAERISVRTANTKRPPVVEQQDWSAEDGFSPRQARFSQNDERYTLALAGRLQMEVESREQQPQQDGCTYAKQEAANTTTYTGITCNGQECRAAVALFQEDSGAVTVSEYRWQAPR